MYSKVLVPLIAILFIANACSKSSGDTTGNNNSTGTSSMYNAGSTMQIERLAIYTNDNVITDPVLIQDFLDRRGTSDDKAKFFINQASVKNPFANISLQFMYNQQVIFNGNVLQITDKQDTLIKLSSSNYTQVDPAGSTCQIIARSVPAFGPQSDCPSCDSYKKVYPLLILNNNYYVPVISYLVVTADCLLGSDEYPMVNILNNDFASSLGKGDSVLVQVGKIPLSKNNQ